MSFRRLIKGRLQSLLRMSVIVFAWGLHRKLASRFILGPGSFLAITRALFLSQAKGVKLEVSKIYWAFWSDNPSNNELWRQHDEYERIPRYQGCFQSVSKCIYFIVFLDESVPFCLRFLMIYLHPQASTKGFQEKNPRRIGHFTQHSCYSLPSLTLWILQWNRLLKPINRGFNDNKILFIYSFNTLSKPMI
jgi:hypothetical protein